MTEFTWAADVQRYRGPDGRFIPEASVRQAVDQVVDGATQRLVTLTQQLRDGQLALADWQQSMAATIKQAHLATALAGHGGIAQASPADLGWVGGQRIRGQYEFLNAWAAQLANGTAPLDGRALMRAGLYGDAARTTYQEQRRRDGRLGGATLERRRRRASESCPGCVDQAARGWQPAGVLPPLGSEQCRTRCKCVWETKRVAGKQEAA